MTTPPAGMANVSGKLLLPDGAPALNSKVKFELVYAGGNLGRVLSTGTIISTEPFFIDVADDGTWATQLFGNDVIVCGIDDTGPSRWRISYVVNGDELPSTDYQINSGANPFTPDDAPICTLPPGNINCAVDYPYVTPPPPPIAGAQGPPGTPGAAGVGLDPSVSRAASWVPQQASGSAAFAPVGDTILALDSGATLTFNSPTFVANYSVTVGGTRLYYGAGFLTSYRNFTFKAAGYGTATGNADVFGVADRTSWYPGFGGAGIPTGNFAAFVAHGANWTCMTGDGTTTASVSTSASATARHTFEIDFTPTSVVFKIDGTVVATITTHLPAAGTPLFLVAGSGNALTVEYLYGSQASV